MGVYGYIGVRFGRGHGAPSEMVFSKVHWNCLKIVVDTILLVLRCERSSEKRDAEKLKEAWPSIYISPLA